MIANQSTKDAIRNALPLPEFLTAEGIKLEPHGRGRQRGLCPFHDDHNPSLVVNVTTNTYKCFGCQKSGDVFTFYMERHKAKFPDAIKDLAARAGVSLNGDGTGRQGKVQGASSLRVVAPAPTPPEPAKLDTVIFHCDSCDCEIEECELEDNPLYECTSCGERFTRDNSANGDSHQCPSCNKFGSKVADHGCSECGAGEMVRAEPAKITVPVKITEAEGATKTVTVKVTKAEPDRPKKIVAEYDYTDAAGKLLYQAVRYEPKTFKQRQPNGTGWTWNMDGVELVLYRLPRVLKEQGTVFVVEGEKDADTLTALGLTATTNVGGAGKWRAEYAEPLRGKLVVILTDNDEPGRNHAVQVARSLQGVAAGVKVIELPNLPDKGDVSDWLATFTDKTEGAERLVAMAEQAPVWTPPMTEAPKTTTEAKPLIQFFSPSELRNYSPPEGVVLVGDCHLTRGATTVIGGAPGVGKSRAAVALAQAGAICADWFGLKVHRKFKSLILQNENGRFRLSKEFADLDCAVLDEFVRVCEPPPFGLAFDRDEFTEAVKTTVDEFKPDVVAIDPWNAVARDEKARDYLDTFNAIRSVLPTGDAAPALVIVAHTRKPKGDERVSGRGLLNLLAGSYVLGSVPRCVFVMQSATDDPTDNRIVWTCCKNNDGELGARSAWQRRNGLFAPVTDFDWQAFDTPEGSGKHRVSVEDVRAQIGQKRSVHYGLLVDEIVNQHNVSERTAKDAIKRAADSSVIRKDKAGLYELP